MSRIGLIAGAMKPVTHGHTDLIMRASHECDDVEVFISTKDRTDDELGITITGAMMDEAWENVLSSIIPENVSIEFVKIPVRSLFETMQAAEALASGDTYVIYSDPDDLESRYNDRALTKYMPNMFANNQILKVPVDRSGDNDVSASLVRRAIFEGDIEAFKDSMPRELEDQQKMILWQIYTRKSEMLGEAHVRSIIKSVVSELCEHKPRKPL